MSVNSYFAGLQCLTHYHLCSMGSPRGGEWCPAEKEANQPAALVGFVYDTCDKTVNSLRTETVYFAVSACPLAPRAMNALQW